MGGQCSFQDSSGLNRAAVLSRNLNTSHEFNQTKFCFALFCNYKSFNCSTYDAFISDIRDVVVPIRRPVVIHAGCLYSRSLFMYITYLSLFIDIINILSQLPPMLDLSDLCVRLLFSCNLSVLLTELYQIR